MRYELQKICGEFYIKILVAILLIVVLVTTIAPIMSFSELGSESQMAAKGLKAVKVGKERYRETRGELTVERLNRTLRYYKTFSSSDVATVQTENKYPGVLSLMVAAYSTSGSSGEAELYKLKNAEDFYSRNTTQIQREMNQVPGKYSPLEQKAIVERAGMISTPFKLDYHEQWKFIYRTLMMVFIVAGILAILIGARLFSYEKRNGMDLVLTTLGRHRIRKIGLNKMVAYLTFLTMLFAGAVSIVTTIFFVATGVSGWDSQIQVGYFLSVYNITFWGAYLLFIFVGWIGLLAIGALVASANGYLQRTYISLIIGILLFVIPGIIAKLELTPSHVQKLFSIQPINGFFTENLIRSLHMYKIIFLDVLAGAAVIINGVAIILLCFCIAPRLFAWRINKGSR